MKILSAEETRQADAYTIKNEPVASIDLMERASKAFTEIFTQHYDHSNPVLIFCGNGNNGGDGLAVARLLKQRKYKVNVYLVNFEGKGSDDFNKNLNRLKKNLEPEILTSMDHFPVIREEGVVIDAIFGSGLTRPVEGFYAEVIAAINERARHVVAIDIASGLFADSPSPGGTIIQPERTISFQMPKLAFMIPENEDFVGLWEIADIGLDKDFIESRKSKYQLLTREYAAQLIRPRKQYAHKGDFGKALLISGSQGKMGAAVLGARACMRTGAGLLTVHVPQCGYEILQTSIPEAMVTTDIEKDYISQYPDLALYNTVGVGPGIGTHAETTQMLYKLLENYTHPMVLDADAINIIGKNRFLLEKLPGGSILTPHLKEFERITAPAENHFERLGLQRAFSEKYKVVIVLKGAHSSVSLPDGNIFFNTSGNPGMATGGSGDVLTGILTGLLAQNYPPAETALLGTFLHGLAGDLAESRLGQQGLIASDIVRELPGAYMMMKQT